VGPRDGGKMKLARQFRDKVGNNELLLGTFIVEMNTSAAPIILRKSGFDFFIVDTEHGNFNDSDTAILTTLI
jgi:2-keto-3-deoxy-L-rhamnonate aldolase RhmA